MEWLGAWEGLLDRLTLAWVCGNLFVLRAAIQGIMVPLGRSAALMPRAGWDLVWDKMPVLLVAALRTSTARDSGQVPNSRRVLPGHVMASVVVEELLQVCAQPDVRRDAGCLAGQLSLVSARNMRTLIQLVGAATIDFRSSSPDSPVSMSADARQPPETRREHATRLYTALARAASDRSNLQEALDLWSQIIWSLLRHLPCVTREEMKMRQDQKWCAGLVFPDYLQALAAGFACPDLAADVLAKLLYEELQEHEAVLRGVWETTTVAMLVAMCSRHRGALFRHWAPVASAFAVVLLVSVKVLGSPGDAAAAKSPQLNGQEHEGGAQELVDEEAKMVDDDEARRIGLVQRLTGGMQAFLVPPADPATKSEEGLPDEEQQVARVEAQVVLALVRHVIPCARGAQIREDLMYMLDSLVGAACSPGAQGRRNSLACNCLEGLLSLADARGMQPLPQTPAPASAPSSPAAPAGNSVTGAPSTASDVPSTCTSSSSTQPSCVSPWADTQVATVNMAAKIAIERCRAILVAYLAMETVLNERLLALPGVRGTRSFKSHDDRTAGGSLRVSAEVALKAMEGLERLRLHPSTFRFLVHALEDRVAIPSPAAGGEEEEVEDEEEEGEAALWLPSMCKEQCLRLVSEGLEEEHAARVMSRGHLLLLFSTIVDTVASENRVLRQMAQSMLRTVALDIRLVTIC